MAKSLYAIDFIRGLRASIPDFVPGFEDGEGRLVSLEIVCPEPFGATPIELHCEEHTEARDALQKVVYRLTSQGERLGVSSFMEKLQGNFPWLKELAVPRVRIVIDSESRAIELSVELYTEDGQFVLPGAYSLEEKERSAPYKPV